MSNEVQPDKLPNPCVSSRRKRRSLRKKAKVGTGVAGAQAETASTRYPLLCFDTETTNHGELLELSVFDIKGHEVYHRYFKPRAKKWPTDIHHITPEMVADEKRFADYRHEIRALLNSTRFLLGCALSNDIANLKRHGVQLHVNPTVLDIQNWYWLLNDDSGREDKHQSGLSTIADHYGLGFGDEHAHSATADTRLTLDCFKDMVSHFDRKFPNYDDTIEPIMSADADASVAEEALCRLVKRYDKAYREALQVYRMHCVAGFISVVRREQGFSLKYNRIVPPENDNIVFSVPVTDRIRAEEDLRKHFEPIQLKGLTGIYEMTDADFEYIKSYRNSIDLETFIVRQREINKAKNIARAITFRNQKRIAAEKSIADKSEQTKANKTKSSKKSGKQSKVSAGRKAIRSARRSAKAKE